MARLCFENNMAAKEMCIQNPIVKGQYGEATNPIFEVFYLDNAHGVIADFSGNLPTSSKKLSQFNIFGAR